MATVSNRRTEQNCVLPTHGELQASNLQLVHLCSHPKMVGNSSGSFETHTCVRNITSNSHMHLEALNTDRKEQHGQDSRKDLRYDFARQPPLLFRVALCLAAPALLLLPLHTS